MTATLTYCYRSIYIFIVLCCALLSPSTQAKNNPSKPSTLPSKIKQALAQAKIPEGALSLYIQAVDETTPRLNWRAEQAMNPASTMKLVTTWAGLRLLGPNYRWRTTFYADQLPVNGVLRGPIYVQGNGDPKLIPEEMEKIMLTLRQMGITTMDGDLVLDKSQFVTTSTSQTIDGEFDRAYNVTPDALLYAFKTLSFQLSPQANRTIAVNVIPPLFQVRIENELYQPTHAYANCNEWRPHVQRRETGEVVARFLGKYPARCGEQAYRVALLSHSEFFWGGFITQWQQAGGQFTHIPKLQEGRVPAQAKLLVTHEGRPLSEVVTDINKFSNNVMARQLFLTLGKHLGRTGEVSSAHAIKAWLATQQLDMPELILKNGSGLSREERISAFNMARLLQQAKDSPLVATLPIVGIDGTMQKRLIGSPVASQAWIKTGTLNDVRAIAGYINNDQGQRYIIVGIINHTRALRTGQKVMDTILEWAYKQAKEKERSTKTRSQKQLRKRKPATLSK